MDLVKYITGYITGSNIWSSKLDCSRYLVNV